MPRYYKGSDSYLHTRNFENVEQLIHHLIILQDDQFKQYKDIAQEYLDERRVPTRKLKRSALKKIIRAKKPRHLIKEIINEIESHKDPARKSELGGGIMEAAHTITGELLHLIGADVILEKVFGINNPQKLVSQNAEIAAYLTDITYQKIEDRKDTTLMFTRLKKYDTDYTSVWENNDTGDITLTVRGTKLSGGLSDIGDDISILFGKTDVSSKDVEGVMNQLEKDYPYQQYDVASHSLGCSFVFSELEHSDNWKELYLFNPASSPFQNTDTLQTFANLPNAHYMLNSGDVVSDGLRQQMNKNTLQNQVYFGDWRWSPIAAHSLTQWVPEGMGMSGLNYDNQKSTPDITYNQDTEASRAANLS